MQMNLLEKRPNGRNYSAAVMIGAEVVTQRTAELKFTRNHFINDNEHETMLVNNLTATKAVLTTSALIGKVVP